MSSEAAEAKRGWLASARTRWINDQRWLHAAAALLYVVAAVVFARPLLAVAATHIAYKPSGDQLFVLSILEWNRTALFANPGSLFEGNFYFGSGGALFGSDLLLGFLPVYGPLALVTQSPVLAYSLTHVLSFALNAGAMYLTIAVLTGSRPGALLAGTVYAFGPLQLAYANHFQFLGAWYLPLVLLFGIRLWRGGGWLDVGLATLMVWIQLATAVHLGVIAGMVYAAFVIPAAIRRVATTRDVRIAIAMIAAGVMASLPFVPIVHGYLSFADAWRASRDITEVQSGSVQLRDYLSPNARLQWFAALQERFPVPSVERRIFPGFVPPLVAALGAGAGLLGLTGKRQELRIVSGVLLVLLALAVLFSLGPNWKRHEVISEHQLPYLWLFEHVPVFGAIRVVARFSLLAHFTLAALGGIAVYAISRPLSDRRFAAPLAGFVVTALVLAEALPKPLPMFAIPTDEPLRAALRDSQPGPLMFVPFNQDDEVWRMWLATETRTGPISNGYSGHIWQQYWFLSDATQDLVASELHGLAAGLQAYGIRAVAVDLRRVDEHDARTWEDFASGPWASGATRVNQHLLITLEDPANPPADRWDDLDTTMLAVVVEPSAGFTSQLIMHNPGSRAWIPPGDARVRRVTMEWVAADASIAVRHVTDVLPPLFLAPGQFHASPIHGFAPRAPGNYRLRISTDGAVLMERPVLVAPVDPTPNDGTVKGMRASFALRTPATFAVHPQELIPVHVEARNIGQTSWDQAHSNVRFGWRWWRIGDDGSETVQPQLEGRILMQSHVYGGVPPGRGYAFSGQIHAPEEPGRYVVRASMLIELVDWFLNEPVEIEVIVKPAEA